ncbi:MAG: lysophospholipid acyltransferase family protein [Elusimicrobiaceae bacterium]|uniref:lysophospholipid acyltransferase family protein n=1 Tax=Candidatus Avelusimicrobium sp. TaxID=3048833 RepID=UPI001B225569|nr:lysophospholipid acyltransferase family protein [Elusimicrobiaceae bacterium]
MPDIEYTDWKHAVGSTLAYFYTVFLGWTTRIYWFKSEEGERLEKEGKGVIYAVWHNQQLFLLYPYKGQKIAPLISQSSDGEYIARCLPKFGMLAVRGSSSRGGARALIHLMHAARDGYSPMLTPDGPRGPIYKVQSGILFLAKKTGLPIIPVGTALSHKIKVGSWDKMRVPLPFGKTALTYGKTVRVKDDADMERAAKELEEQLNWATDQSEMFVNKKHFDNTKA